MKLQKFIFEMIQHLNALVVYSNAFRVVVPHSFSLTFRERVFHRETS